MLNIAITGAGPVGLTFARLMSISSVASDIKITIFEKDVSRTSRNSIGGTLDLHPNTGLAAMRKMDLWDEFLKYARFEGEEMRMCDMNGMVYFHQIEAPQIPGFDARPEIDRLKLMEVLLDAVSQDVIRWGKQVKEVVEEEGNLRLRLADDTVEGPFDLIIGADGAWSKVRRFLTDVQPSYSGIGGLSGVIDQESAGDRWEEISSMVGKGTNFVLSNGRSMIGQRMGDGSLKCSFNQRREKEWLEELKEKYEGNDEAFKRVLLQEYKDWIPGFQQWISASKQLWCSLLWELPIGHRFEHKAGITLIGDAAHLMTPFAGEGVNAGMRDALDLAAEIEKAITEQQAVDVAIQNFEASMFVRADKFMSETMVNKIGMHAQDAPCSFFANMSFEVPKELGYDLTKGWLSYIYLPIWSTVYSLIWTMGMYGALRRRLTGVFRRKE